jgi:hypothetical protein
MRGGEGGGERRGEREEERRGRKERGRTVEGGGGMNLVFLIHTSCRECLVESPCMHIYKADASMVMQNLIKTHEK